MTSSSANSAEEAPRTKSLLTAFVGTPDSPVLLREYLDQLDRISQALIPATKRALQEICDLPDGYTDRFGLSSKRKRVKLDSARHVLDRIPPRDRRVHIAENRDDSPGEILNHLAGIRRLLDVGDWILDSDEDAVVLLCNPTTTQWAWSSQHLAVGGNRKALNGCPHDLVVRAVAGDGRHELLVVEVTDTSGTGRNAKLSKDIRTLAACRCTDPEADKNVRYLLAVATSGKGTESAAAPEPNSRSPETLAKTLKRVGKVCPGSNPTEVYELDREAAKLIIARSATAAVDSTPQQPLDAADPASVTRPL